MTSWLLEFNRNSANTNATIESGLCCSERYEIEQTNGGTFWKNLRFRLITISLNVHYDLGLLGKCATAPVVIESFRNSVSVPQIARITELSLDRLQ